MLPRHLEAEQLNSDKQEHIWDFALPKDSTEAYPPSPSCVSEARGVCRGEWVTSPQDESVSVYGCHRQHTRLGSVLAFETKGQARLQCCVNISFLSNAEVLL